MVTIQFHQLQSISLNCKIEKGILKTSNYNNLSVTFGVSCFSHQNSSFMIVEKLANDNYLCNRLKVKHTESFYTSTLDSEVFDIGFVDNFG